MPATVLGTHGSGDHASRPAGNTVPDGSLYSCSDHGLIYISDYAGNSWSTWATLGSFSDPLTTRGDIITRGAATTGRLALGASGKMLGSDGTDALWSYPPGRQIVAATRTSNLTVSNTSEAAADTIMTCSATAFDGTLGCYIDFFCSGARPDATAASRTLNIWLFDDTGGGAAGIGKIAQLATPAAAASTKPIFARFYLTPSNATHTFSVRASVSAGSGLIIAGAGGAGTDAPAFLRVYAG